MAFFVRDGGSWKEVEPGGSFSVRDGGSWKTVKEAWIRDGGSWKTFYIDESVNLDGHIITHQTFGGENAIAQVEFRSDGTVWETKGTTTTQIDDTTDWIIPRPPSASYWIRATLTSGVSPTSGLSDSLDTWLSLSSNRLWRNSAGTIGQDFTSNLFIEIASDSGGSNILDSGTYTIRADKN